MKSELLLKKTTEEKQKWLEGRGGREYCGWTEGFVGRLRGPMKHKRSRKGLRGYRLVRGRGHQRYVVIWIWWVPSFWSGFNKPGSWAERYGMPPESPAAMAMGHVHWDLFQAPHERVATLKRANWKSTLGHFIVCGQLPFLLRPPGVHQ